MKRQNYFDEAGAVKALEDGDINRALKLSHVIITRFFKSKGVDDEDLISKVFIRTWRAMAQYRASKGRLFSFVTKICQNHLTWYRYGKHHTKEKKYGIELVSLSTTMRSKDE